MRIVSISPRVHDHVNLLMQWRPQVAALLCLVPVIALLSGSAAMAALTVLDFEDIAAGTTITTQYGPRGVIFDRAFLSPAPLFSPATVARSGTRVLRSDNPRNEFHAPPLVMTFTSPQRRVRLFGGSEVVPISGMLRAFVASNTEVGVDGPKLVAANVFTTMFEVTVTTPSITRVELQYEGIAFEAIDDLEFEGEPPGTLPTVPPVVQITSPVSGPELDVSTIDIAGTVTGEGLLPIIKLTIAFRRPPESTAPPFTSDLILTGSGTTRPFSLPGFSGVPLGPITVTVEAENIGALKGSASIAFTNLPVAIGNRFTDEGGAAAFGAFRFGLFLAGCKIAIYEQGAITMDGAGTTRLIRGQTLNKWLSLTGTFNSTLAIFPATS